MTVVIPPYGRSVPEWTVQITSDVHLDVTKDVFLPKDPLATILVIAGDLGKPFQANYLAFLTKASTAYEHVILISGNHEYYSSGHTKSQIDEKISLVAATFPNVHYLLEGSVTLGGVLFLGTTLWSHITDAYQAQEVMSDYSQIKKKVGTIKKKISPSDTLAWHLEELEWLEGMLASNPSTPTVVVTHHAPSFQSLVPFHLATPTGVKVDDAYATNLEGLITSHPQIKVWVHGHVHHPLDYPIGTTRIIANPVGYPGQLGAAKIVSVTV